MVGFVWGGITDAMRQAAARQLGGSSNIANEQLGTLGGTSTLQSMSGRVPAKHTYWGQVKLAAGSN